MSSKALTPLSRKVRDTLLVCGFVRTVAENTSMNIPDAIVDICFLWYHINSFLMKAGDYCMINETKDVVEYKREKPDWKGNSCYGSIEMPSICDRDIDYEFVLKVLKLVNVIGIGIDDAQCKWTNRNFSVQPYDDTTKHYAYISSSGSLYSWISRDGEDYGVKYDTGDVIKMVYNPYKSTLYFVKNGKTQKVIENIYGEEGLSYRLCIYIGWGNAHQIVQLLDEI